MKDRIPTYAGRVKLTPVENQPNIYDMERADKPLQEGTPLNKNTFLSDNTASQLGLSDNATPDDALSLLNSKRQEFEENVRNLLNGKAPMYTYGTQDIEAGTASAEPEGTLHFVYEV